MANFKRKVLRNILRHKVEEDNRNGKPLLIQESEKEPPKKYSVNQTMGYLWRNWKNNLEAQRLKRLQSKRRSKKPIKEPDFIKKIRKNQGEKDEK